MGFISKQTNPGDTEAQLPRISYNRNIGRPTDYGPHIIEKTKQYIDSYESMGLKMPTKQGLSLFLGINQSTMYEWLQEDDKREFSEIVKAMKAIAHENLVTGGLDGSFNASITKLMLSKHGYNDTEDKNAGLSVNITINRDLEGVVIEGESAKVIETDDY